MLNDIINTEYNDLYSEKRRDNMIIYHGSNKEVKRPLFGYGKPDNDYGSGFYATENVESAREWAVINGQPEQAICNCYILDTDNLNILYLNEYGTLAWIAEIIANRGANNAIDEEIGQMIVEKYKVDTSNVDVIIGYRADDSYIKIVDSFLEGKLTIDEVDMMFRKGKLGMQVFIKSHKAFDSIIFTGSETVAEKHTYGDYDRIARKEVTDYLNKRERAILIEGFDVASKGLTVRDAINHQLGYDSGYYYIADEYEGRDNGYERS